MDPRLVAGAAVLVTAVAGVTLAPVSAASAPEPGAKSAGAKSTWTEADKTGFGTARSRGSNVWFTLQGGRVSEVFYPDLSTPSVRTLELVVDGFVDRPTGAAAVTRPDPRSLRFRQVGNRHPDRYRLTQQVVTDPAHDSLVVRARLTSLDGGTYRLYALYDPALGNEGTDDRATSNPHSLIATDGAVTTALVSKPALRSTTSGLAGTPTDPRRDLDGGHALAGPGNVVQAALLPDRVTLSLGFGRSATGAMSQARGSLRSGFARTRTAYDGGWHRYLDSLRDVPASAAAVRDQYLASALVLAAAEDKVHRGAFIASPSAPWVWGDEVPDLSSPSGAYHLVWSRDAYQFGTALWAMGDRAAARRMVGWLFGTQQKPDGSFPQNSDVSGEPVWSELQLDEVALPIVLAHLGGQAGRGDLAWGAQGGALPGVLPRRGDGAPRAVHPAGEVGEPVRLLAQLDRGPDRGARLGGRPGENEGSSPTGAPVAGGRRPVAGTGRTVDGDPQRTAVGRPLLPAADQGRPAQPRHDVRDG